MYDRPLDATEIWLKKKFSGKDAIIEANTEQCMQGTTMQIQQSYLLQD